MQKVWSIIKTGHTGFSLVEILLAVTIFALLATAVIGALVYGRNSTAGSGEHLQANLLADEALEAVRNVRNAGYANLTDGTYGLVQSGGVWTFSGTSDVNDIYTRRTTIATSDTNRKTVTSNVTWSGVGGEGQTSVVTQLTNWAATLPKLWSSPSQYGGVDTSGSIAGYKIATAGSYAYLVRNSATGPNFFVINISTPTSPTVVGSLTLAGTPTNVTVSGNYAYVSNSSSTSELQIVNVTTPNTPGLAGTYNAPGSSAGLGVYAVGTTVYLARAANAANNEFVVVSAATPASPVRITGYNLNITMNEVYVNGTIAYIATGSDTQELLVINMAASPTLTLGTALNLTGTTDARTIDGYGSMLTIGQGTALYTVNLSNPSAPTLASTMTMPGTVNDVTLDSTHGYAFVGTNYATGELQIINMNTITAPVTLSSVNMTGSLSLMGVDYNATYDVVSGASSSTTQEAVVFGPN